VTVEDPVNLVEPFVMTPRILRLSTNPDAGLLPERGNCEVYELGDITSQNPALDRRGGRLQPARKT
jgi:hypothetical protein